MDKKVLQGNNKVTKRQETLSYFYIYSFLGWILEMVYCVLMLGVFNKRGFLYGPVCPIYGFGAIILIQSLKSVKTNNIGKFFIAMVIFTVFEYIVSVVLENLFGLRWWDYTNEPFNFQGRVSLAFSIIWGIIGVIFIEKVHPFVEVKVRKYTSLINEKVQIIILNILLLTIIIDFILSIVKYINI